VNTGEEIAEVSNEDLAVSMAENLAKKSDYIDQFEVIEMVVRYETKQKPES
jgi:hypothetical protein